MSYYFIGKNTKVFFFSGKKRKCDDGLSELLLIFNESEEHAAEREEEHVAEREARIRERELELEARQREREGRQARRAYGINVLKPDGTDGLF